MARDKACAATGSASGIATIPGPGSGSGPYSTTPASERRTTPTPAAHRRQGKKAAGWSCSALCRLERIARGAVHRLLRDSTERAGVGLRRYRRPAARPAGAALLPRRLRLPLLLAAVLTSCGQQLLCAYLRPSRIDGAKHAAAILELLVCRLRQAWGGRVQLCRTEPATRATRDHAAGVEEQSHNPRCMVTILDGPAACAPRPACVRVR